MIKNKLKEIWAEGRPSINGWLSIGNAFTAEIMAAQGYDSVSIDIQHGALDYNSVLPMFQAMRASGVVPMARVPWLEPGIIMKVLDAGAYGVICPMVNTAAQAAEFVSYLRYPPHGQRSFGPTRVSFAAGPNYAGEANEEILAFAMVETKQAMENLDAIAATPGLDGIYVGPADLTFSLTDGRLAPAFDREEPEMIEALQRIVAACKKNRIRAALHCGTPEYAARAIQWGFDMTTVSGDTRLLAAAAAASVTKFRDLVGQISGSAEKGAY
ncbi:2,4-dihydroxyhept-2-ene-1,7-dioic acid aldolase [Rhizobium leguminosarum]|uniref:HpcH/HpaI aldolase family protein n=1 Tax=Rhizobium leguminosarum TaxID=384 RepID=UPI001C979445|nr:aldolase/citrate lyase family protein [Rhizobium leguminosarum]MBY5610483.1 2,4-dihydroxyhept-2-ene-1,7-dioic acid aldolase [Rhizobium leguminosarum]MBY5655375.1 2,4-dihydroxyhept-2-ene-1,7-dioic acid aldolase [Rhizobium leguminosarum]MBY5670169.1 2,4-dihydroxyhept-2-ene-1,7-dioic acid aldolase [Rhizobium leguminosarum]MBY5684680.1 2,4-dihydroxyhept-2-ene-1,7-dioic acid aldolase [Rhizobium leguminosarum]